jgi:hypothetical protein
VIEVWRERQREGGRERERERENWRERERNYKIEIRGVCLIEAVNFG